MSPPNFNNNSPLIGLGTRPCNIGGLVRIEIPTDFNVVPDQNKPVVAVYMTVEQHGMLLNQLSQNSQVIGMVLQALIEEVKPTFIAQLMTKQLIEPTPQREVLIHMLKALEASIGEHRRQIDENARNPTPPTQERAE